MINKQRAEGRLRKLFQGGVMKRIPRNSEDARLFLALAASSFDPRNAYSEAAVNEQLKEWMDGFTCPHEMDHVSLRRHLVDSHFVLRDKSGIAYRPNQAVINQVIEPAARSIQPRYLLEDVQRERKERKHANAT